jgi:short subunit dehydrogenase-like uncharacterized protein
MGGNFLIYGATGYTGKLVAKAAHEAGLKPLLAGRNEAKVKAVAEPLGFPWRAFSLDDAGALDAALREVDLVLHIAGPFSHTSKQMVDACLRTGRHYLDITGEIAVLAACQAHDEEAKNRNIMIMPGVGFDVVPSDCLAAHMKKRLPDATELTLAIGGLEKMSRGTAKSSFESVGDPTKVRRNGRVESVWPPPRRAIDFGKGPKPAIAVGWGDVFTAYFSTGIPNITVYFESMPQLEQMAKMGAFLRKLLSTGPLQAVLKWWADTQPEGPTDAERAEGFGILIGEAVNAKGDKRVSRLRVPEGYTLTAMTSLEIARRVLAGDYKEGFMTPSMAYGESFITQYQNCVMEDLA